MKNIIFLIVITIFYSCSQYSTKTRAKAWHNFNAKYNAYLQAKDKLKEAEQILISQHKDNYSEIIPILLPLDSTAAKGVSAQLEAVIKKSSLIAEKHQNANFLGDSYNLIGKARLYKGDIINAIETFKYVNSEATKQSQKHEAMVLLMRAYLEAGDESTALRVAEILKEEPLNKINSKDFYLTKAHIHQLQKEYKLSTAILEEALPFMKRGEQKARVHFAAGQMYEKLNNTRSAALHYKAVLQNKPSYDLAFYSELNKMMFSPGASMKETFTKLSKDRKNADLLDKLYYSMALIEEKSGDLTKAIEYLQKATKVKSQGNQNIALAYLKLGDLNYFRLQDYEKSKAYYDSALVLLPPNSKDFEKIADRKRALDDYSIQKNTINTEDSLQRMANLSPEVLENYLTESINRKLDKEKKDIETAKKISQANAVSQTNLPTGDPNAKWYLYNENALMAGRIEFTQKWGQRKLEDNWRRIIKENLNFEIANIANADSSINVADIDTDDNKIESLKKEIKAKLPKNEADYALSNKKKEEAYFNLGKIYKLYLLENQNSIQAFEKLIALNSKSDFAPEAIYYLILLNEGTSKGDYWKNELNRSYPNSYFARRINRGNENLTNNEEAKANYLYTTALENYENNKNTEALQMAEEAMKTYPGSQLEDKFAFLKILILAKNASKDLYILALDDFLQSHTKSTLLPLAKEMKEGLSPNKTEEPKD